MLAGLRGIWLGTMDQRRHQGRKAGTVVPVRMLGDVSLSPLRGGGGVL